MTNAECQLCQNIHFSETLGDGLYTLADCPDCDVNGNGLVSAGEAALCGQSAGVNGCITKTPSLTPTISPTRTFTVTATFTNTGTVTRTPTRTPTPPSGTCGNPTCNVGDICIPVLNNCGCCSH